MGGGGGGGLFCGDGKGPKFESTLPPCPHLTLHIPLPVFRRVFTPHAHFLTVFGVSPRIFSVCAPPPPSTLCAPQLQSMCHYIVNHYVKILHVRLGGANNMRPLSCGGGGTNGKDPSPIIASHVIIVPHPHYGVIHDWCCGLIMVYYGNHYGILNNGVVTIMWDFNAKHPIFVRTII